MKQRLFDLILSTICLILVAIPMSCIALTIRFIDGAPIFFRQTRIGRNMCPFRLYKFRTMKTSSENNNSLTIGKDARVTRLGHWLRKYHLDELPQLFNIFVGDMSFIGYRPELPEFIDPDNPIQRQVLLVRPGLFDSATLHWLDEAQILGQVDDWKEYYCKTILPDKLIRSLNDIKNRSVINNIRILRDALKLVLFQRTVKKQAEETRWER